MSSRVSSPGWPLVAHDELDQDSNEPWNGRKLILPAHIHIRRPGDDLDVQVNERAGEQWILNRDPRVAIHLPSSIKPSAWGLPMLVPEVILFYKVLDTRTKDKGDLEGLLPLLTAKQIEWLRDATGRVRPEHPWLKQLTA